MLEAKRYLKEIASAVSISLAYRYKYKKIYNLIDNPFLSISSLYNIIILVP
jgi:hypothetical protein